MVRINVEAELNAKQEELTQISKDITRIDNLIQGLTKQLKILKENKQYILYKIEDLEEELDNGNE